MACHKMQPQQHFLLLSLDISQNCAGTYSSLGYAGFSSGSQWPNLQTAIQYGRCEHVFERWPCHPPLFHHFVSSISFAGSASCPHMHFQVAAVHFACQAQNAMAGGYQSLTLLQAVEGAIKEEGWQTVMLLRLSPILPFALLNYALSVTPISSWTYIWASAVGIIPGTAGDPASLSQRLLQWLNSLRAFCRTVQAAPEIHSHV